MTEATPETAAAQEPSETTPAQSEQQAETPPWGDDFDPDKAWRLVQNLRADKEKLAARPTLSEDQQRQLQEYDRLVEASKTDAERREEAAEKAQREAEDSRAEAARYRSALRNGISEDDFDFLGVGTEEEIEARAVRFAQRIEAARQSTAEATAPAARRPVSQLRPGASPAPDPTRDDSYYPPEWLTPSQRARLDAARGTST